MGVLHVKDRIVLRLLGDLGKVEIERLVVAPGQHDKAEDVLADLVDDLAQGDEGAGALRHAHRLALVEQIDELAQFDVERRGAVGHRLDRGLHALDIAAVVGAPDIDQLGKAAAELVAMIGDVGGEIGPRAVGFFERPVDVVAELGGAEQGLRPRLPIVGRSCPWAAPARRYRSARARRGRRDTRRSPRPRPARARTRKRRGARRAAPDRRGSAPSSRRPRNRAPAPSHSLSGPTEPFAAVALGQRPAGLDQVFAGIKPVGDRADVLAQRLAVAQMERAGEDVDLGAGVVDVILAVRPRTRPWPAAPRARRRRPRRGRGRHASARSGWPRRIRH